MPRRFDTTKGRGVFETAIGIGKVIKGKYVPSSNTVEDNKSWQRLGHWCVGDECRREVHLDNLKVEYPKLTHRYMLTFITSDFAYGDE